MKAIIYTRVSTQNQADKGYSLEAQETDCIKFANEEGFVIDKIFVERGESAKNQQRTQLQRLIKYCIENKSNLTALIIWKYDRLARILSDQAELVKRFSQLGIRVLAVTENNEDNSVGRLMRNIIGSFAQYENDVKAERTISGMKKCIESGRWCWRAPIGYKHTKNVNEKSILTPNEESKHIIKAFELFESKLFKQADIVVALKKQGFKRATPSLINRILQQSLYAGLIKPPWSAEYVDGIHQSLITKETFFKVPAMLNRKISLLTSKDYKRNHFPLQAFIRCPKCEKKLTGAFSTGRKGVKYPITAVSQKDALCLSKKTM